MKLKFKRQKFQEDAAKAVCDVFTGQPNIQPAFRVDKGYVKGDYQARYVLDDKGQVLYMNEDITEV